MTREEAIEELKRDIHNAKVTHHLSEHYKMAIKSLEQEPCEDAISRDEVFKQINCWIGSGEYKYAMSERFLIDRIKTLPPVKPQEPKTGHWIDHQEGKWIYAKCSECGTIHDTRTNYCPNCGCRMFKPQESEGV